MNVAIMQPYLFPYIGYFQLMAAADCFVFHDDVQYIKGGWINRNRVLQNGSASWLTLSVAKASSHLPINQRHYFELDKQRATSLRKLRSLYAGAAHFEPTMALLERCMACPDDNVATFNQHGLQCLAEALGLETRFATASALPFPKQLKGQQRVLALCAHLGAERYINPIGGTALYSQQDFAAAGLQLRFLASQDVSYPQFEPPFVPSLSIIDLLMFTGTTGVRQRLAEYRLVRGADAQPTGVLPA